MSLFGLESTAWEDNIEVEMADLRFFLRIFTLVWKGHSERHWRLYTAARTVCGTNDIQMGNEWWTKGSRDRYMGSFSLATISSMERLYLESQQASN